MFFRRQKNKGRGIHQPVMGKDGNLYVEEGQDYDSDQYETDSDYSSNEEEGLEYEIDEDASDDDDDDVAEECAEEESLKEDGNTIDDQQLNGTRKNHFAEGDENEGLQDDLESIVSKEDENEEANLAECQDSENMNTKMLLDEEISLNDNIRTNSEQMPLIPDRKISEKMVTNDFNSEVEVAEVTEVEVEKKDANEEQQLSGTTLHEKRSLLALAAQHDRVDIIKTILQSTHPDSTNQKEATQLIQLLLNNKIVPNVTSCPKDENKTGSILQTKNLVSEVFLPPLHIAVASSATNAACCLLRMGADPSIRPAIPENWDGPSWDEEKKKEDVISHWRKLDGLSAWEVAFGCESRKNNIKKLDLQSGKSMDESKRSWFGWSSNNSETNSKGSPSFDIAPSKLEGIKHAFTAETLRAIGSDEVNRLRELLSSGLNTSLRGKQNNGDHGVEIGGRDLIGWCAEMNAERCSEMLKESYSSSTYNNESEEKKDESTSTNLENVSDKEKQTNLKEKEDSSIEAEVDEEASETELLSLKIKLEENRVLAGSLSLVLDNLAEEVSLTQGLLYQQGDSTNSALLSQVRTLKENRSDTESEISEWEGRLADRIVELRLVLTWWKNKGGSEDDFAEIFDGGVITGDVATALPMNVTTAPLIEEQNNEQGGTDLQMLKNRIMEMKAQVTLSESKVKKLRSSIVDLAEENSRNLVEVTKKGLGGAVSLARKLKEEVKEREHILQNLKQREAACRTRVCMIRNQLEKLNEKATITNKTVDEEEDKNEGKDEDENVVITESEENKDDDMNGNQVQSEEVLYYDEEEDCFIEYVDNSDDSDVEYEYYTDSDDEEEEQIPLSEIIRSGRSTALVVREEQHEFLSLKLWELFMRVIGLSKQAIKQTAKDHGLNNLGNLPRAMIV